jgi:hypothetical protein
MVKNRSDLYSNHRIHIQTIQFKFKWINWQTTPHYHPPTPVVSGSAGDTARFGSNTSGTVRSSQAVALPPARLTTSVRAGGSG